MGLVSLCLRSQNVLEDALGIKVNISKLNTLEMYCLYQVGRHRPLVLRSLPPAEQANLSKYRLISVFRIFCF